MASHSPIRKKDALEYHEFPVPGKFEIVPTKPLSTQRDLALAYSPGVAEPCRAIVENPDDVFRYTNKGNLVAVISNGTATLGLGDIGPLACKPVMEGKAVLFKVLAGIDTFDIELDAKDPDVFIQCVRAMEPTFGAINLEDIKAPECFYIEEQLRASMNIPVFHDDQHGTAIIVGSALINALLLQEKKIEDVKIVFSGAGAAAIACARLFCLLGANVENIMMTDIDGVVHSDRENLDEWRRFFAKKTTARKLAQVMEGADVFVGLSAGGIVSQDMVKSMADRAIIFALANPDSEISYPDAIEVRPDIIMATGRTDFPNQVNNVLGFPFVFRGALDVGARAINEEMKIAAVNAIAALAREEVPESVLQAYGTERLHFGREYIIPKPFDPRVLLRVAPAIAEAAAASGVARRPIKDMHAYRDKLEASQALSKGMMRFLIRKARRSPKRILFPEGGQDKILHAAQILVDEQIAIPVLMGNVERIRARAAELEIDLSGTEIFDHNEDPEYEQMVKALYQKRQRRGVTRDEARARLRHRETYGMLLLDQGRADGLVSGITKNYGESLRPGLEVVGTRLKKAFGVHIVLTKAGPLFFADTTVNINPDAETLAQIAMHTADFARSFDVTPRVAMLSYSNFGQSDHEFARKVSRAAAIVRQKRPDLQVDGEMQVDPALDLPFRAATFDFAQLEGTANVLIFPLLDASNIAYKLMRIVGGAEVIGPVLLGMNKPMNIIDRAGSVASIVNLTVMTVIEAQRREIGAAL